MLRFIKFFQGYLYVVIRGYSPERFLNLCSSHNIVLWNLLPADDGYTFCISLKAFRRLRPLLRKTGTRIHIIRRCGLPFLLFRYRRHRFFLFGIGCAAAVLFLMSQYIWKVEITGNSFYSDQVLLEYLEDSGVGYGIAKRKTDCGEVETLLRRHFPDITWVSARISGTRLYLIVQERLGGDDAKPAKDETPADLISDCKGTVAAVTTRRGTPLVAKGDKVKKGTVLVSGRVDIRDDAGEVSGSNFCRADADVLIRTRIPYENHFPLVYEKHVETGEKRRRFSLIFGKYDLTLGRGAKKNGNWTSTRQLFPVRIGEDFYLPFQIAVTCSEEYVVRQDTYTDAEIREKSRAELERYLENLSKNGIQIVKNNVMIDKNDREVSVSGKIRVIKKADVHRDIDPAGIQEDKSKHGTDTADNGDSD